MIFLLIAQNDFDPHLHFEEYDNRSLNELTKDFQYFHLMNYFWPPPFDLRLIFEKHYCETFQ